MSRKRSAGGNGSMSGFKAACRIKPNALGDWQILPPAGKIVQIGDAGVTATGLTANDDLFVSGSMEIRDMLYVHGQAVLYDDLFITASANLSFTGANGEGLIYARMTEEVTIAIGQGVPGINSSANLCPANSIILGVVCRITQAPGGGGTLFDLGRNPVGPEEFVTNSTTAVGSTYTVATDGDGSLNGPFFNDIARPVKTTLNGNVTISDMKIRITVFYVTLFPPES